MRRPTPALAEVRALFPDHAEAARLAGEVRERLLVAEREGGTPPAVVLAGSVTVVVLVGALLFVRLRGHRAPRPRAEAPRPDPSSSRLALSCR